MLLRGLQGPPMTDSIKRRLPGGRVVSTAAGYMSGWRAALEPLLATTGWTIHSFLDGAVVLMSADMKHKQRISLEFFEALQKALHVVPFACTVEEEGKVTDDSTPRKLRVHH